MAITTGTLDVGLTDVAYSHAEDKYHYTSSSPLTERVHCVHGHHGYLYPSEYGDGDDTPEMWASAQKLRIEQFLGELSGGKVHATFVANASYHTLHKDYPPYWRIQLDQGESYAEYKYITFDAGRIGKYDSPVDETAVRMELKEPRGWELWPATEMFPLISQWYHEQVVMNQEFKFDFNPTFKSVRLGSLEDINTNSGQALTKTQKENRDEYVASRSNTPINAPNPYARSGSGNRWPY